MFDFFRNLDMFLYIGDITQASADSVKAVVPSLTELDFLREQITYLKSANDGLTSSYRSLNQSFSSFTNTINLIFGIAAILLAVVTGSVGFVGFQAIKSAVDAVVQREVSKEISQRLEGRFEYLERVVGRENILDKVEISYYTPKKDPTTLPEFLAISNRFKRVSPVEKVDGATLKGNIIILDIENSNISDEDGIKEAKAIAKAAKKWVVLIVYTSNNFSPIVNYFRSPELPEKEKIEYVAANAKATLITRVADAAYISDALQSV
jgi:hypothetical protein